MNKKNKVLFFFFSLIPGAAHMYIGLVKRGLVIMLAFVAAIGFPVICDLPVLLVVLPVLWFYSFFDAWNKYNLPAEKFAKISDDFLFFMNAVSEDVRSDPRVKKFTSNSFLKIGGIAAVLLGAYLLWDKVVLNICSNFLSDAAAAVINDISYRIPQLAVAILLIVIGVKLIAHKKQELDGKDEGDSSDWEDK